MSKERFKRRSRILKSREFELLTRKGRRVNGGAITLLTINNNLDRPRLGLTVSKKVSKRAVDRNRIKRWSREIFRRTVKNLSLSLDIVIIARPRSLEMSFVEYQETLTELFNKLTRA